MGKMKDQYIGLIKDTADLITRNAPEQQIRVYINSMMHYSASDQLIDQVYNDANEYAYHMHHDMMYSCNSHDEF